MEKPYCRGTDGKRTGVKIHSETKRTRNNHLPIKTGDYSDHKFEREIPSTNNRYSSTPYDLLKLKPASQPLQVPIADFAGVHRTNRAKTPTNDQRRNLHAAAEQYIQLIPRLNSVTSSNFAGVLLEVLRGTETEVSLDDFFHLFFISQGSHWRPIASALGNPSYRFSSLEATSQGLALCHLIHDTFVDAKSAATYFEIDSTSLSSANINAHEFHRVFLATKILIHCVKEVDSPGKKNGGLIKSSIYNMYQIYCLRLFSKASSSEGRASSDSLFLGQASIGKLMKIMFPNAETKRLGKRGCSKYYLVGVTWTNSPSKDEISQSLDLEPSQIKSQYKSVFPKFGTNTIRSRKPTEWSRPILISNTSAFAQSLFMDAPLLSYVNSSSKFPATNFSPRVKECTPSRVPLQSKWLRELMYRSVHALKAYNVDLKQLVEYFQAGEFSIDSDSSLCTAVLRANKELDQSSAPENAYLHLYLGVLTLVLPSILASGEEINHASKVLLHACLRKLIHELKNKRAKRPSFEKNHQCIFRSLLQKLIYISQSISAPSPTELAKDIVRGIFDHFTTVQKEGEVHGDKNVLYEICSRSIITTLNAHSYIPATCEEESFSLINSFIKTFEVKCSETATELLAMISEMKLENSNSNIEDLRFKIFKLFIESFHRSSSQNDHFLNLPIFVFRYYFIRFDMVIQSMNLSVFGKLRPVVATEIFKTWFLINASFHEYIIVISEIVALGQVLDREEITRH